MTARALGQGQLRVLFQNVRVHTKDYLACEDTCDLSAQDEDDIATSTKPFG